MIAERHVVAIDVDQPVQRDAPGQHVENEALRLERVDLSVGSKERREPHERVERVLQIPDLMQLLLGRNGEPRRCEGTA